MTSDGGLILIRELDERLGLEKLIEERLSDSRQGSNKQFTLTDLPRQSVCSRLAGYEDLNDAERLAADPTFRLISSLRIWDRGASDGQKTSRWHPAVSMRTALVRNFLRRGSKEHCDARVKGPN